MKSKLQKLGNKSFISKIAKRYLNPWVRKGNHKLRLKVVRDLKVPETLPADETFKDPKEMSQEFAFNLVKTLVDVGKGEERTAQTEKARAYVLYPYGSKGAETYTFKTEFPDSYFSTTLTEIYPFIATDFTDTTRWAELLKQCHHPMTKLWPFPLMKRFMSYMTKFKAQREALFAGYEQAGGEYFEEEEVSPPTKKARVDAAAAAAVDVPEEEYDDFDI